MPTIVLKAKDAITGMFRDATSSDEIELSEISSASDLTLGSGASSDLLLSARGTTYNFSATGAALTTTAQDVVGSLNEINASISSGFTLSSVLAIGNTTGGTDIEISSGDAVLFKNGPLAGDVAGFLIPAADGVTFAGELTVVAKLVATGINFDSAALIGFGGTSTPDAFIQRGTAATIDINTTIGGGGDGTLRATTIRSASIDATAALSIGAATATSLVIGRSGVTTDFPSGSLVDFTGATVTGLSTSTLAAVLAAGNSTGGTDLEISTGDELVFENTPDLFLTYGGSSGLLDINATTGGGGDGTLRVTQIDSPAATDLTLVPGGDSVDVVKSADAYTNLLISNLNTGGSAAASLFLRADGGNAQVLHTSAGHTAGNPADALVLVCSSDTSGGINVRTNHTSGPIFRIYRGSVERWQWNNAGHILAGADNTYDIGASGATRPRTTYLGTSLNVGSGITPSTANGDLVAGDTTRSLHWDASTPSLLLTSANGVIRLQPDSSTLQAQITSPDNATTVGWRWAANGTTDTYMPTTYRQVRTTVTAAAGFGTADRTSLELSSGALLTATQVDHVWANATGGGKIALRVSEPGIGADGAGRDLFWVQNDGTVDSVQFRANIIAATDNLYDIGASGATRPRTGYFGTSVVVGSTTTITTDNVTFSGAGTVQSQTGKLELRTSNTSAVEIGTNLTTRWIVASAGHLTTASDNVYDIGADSATRPRTAYLGTSLNVGNGIAASINNGDVIAGDGIRTLEWEASSATLSLLGDTTASVRAPIFGSSDTLESTDTLFKSGDASLGDSGNVSVDTGAVAGPTTGVAGIITIGGTNASGLVLGRDVLGVDIPYYLNIGGDVVSGDVFIQRGDASTVGTLDINTTIDGGGDGTLRVLRIESPASTDSDLTLSSGSGTLVIDSHILTSIDNVYDIGALGTTRPRTIYVGTSVVVGNTTTITTDNVNFDGDTFLSRAAAGTLNVGTTTGASDGTVAADTVSLNSASPNVGPVTIKHTPGTGGFTAVDFLDLRQGGSSKRCLLPGLAYVSQLSVLGGLNDPTDNPLTAGAALLGSGGVTVPSAGMYRWSGDTNAAGATDTFLNRGGAGVVDVNATNNGLGDGTLRMRTASSTGDFTLNAHSTDIVQVTKPFSNTIVTFDGVGASYRLHGSSVSFGSSLGVTVNDNIEFKFGLASNWDYNSTENALIFGFETNGVNGVTGHILFVENSWRARSYGLANVTYPNIRLYSGTDPISDPNQYWEWHHDGTNAVLNTGSGQDVLLCSNANSIMVGGATASVSLPGSLNIGTATDAAAAGALAAGLTGAGRLYYDQSANTLNFYESAGGTLRTTLAFNTALTTTSQDIIGAINEIDAAAGTGDVSGPASSTDNAVARFDGTGGKTLQNSGVTIDDNAVVAGVSRITTDEIRPGVTVALTDAATVLFTVALPAGTRTGGTADIMIEATDGTDHQVAVHQIRWAAVNKAGAYTTKVELMVDENPGGGLATATEVTSFGTISATYDITTGTDLINIRVTPTGSLTETTYQARVLVHNLSDQAITYP